MVLEMAASVLLAGCGGAEDELPREGVSGTVKLNGEPMKAGAIQFQPGQQAGATAGRASITDGNYSISKAEGLVPGKYQVQIFGPQAAPAPAKVEMPGESRPIPPAKETIPAKYNAKSTLTAEVKKDGPNKFDFLDLKDK
jgi:hypothetical protein